MAYTRTLRDRRVLRARCEVIEAERRREPDEYQRGVTTALRWVLGDVQVSPANGLLTPDPPEVPAIVREYLDAGDVPYRRGKKLPLNPNYAVGVEDALMWAVSASDGPPG